jgi:serine phosphatase RsbU (regulator of sigma subunit)
MLNPRRTIIAPLILWNLLAGATAFLVAYSLGSYFYASNLTQLITGLGIFLALSTLILAIKLHIPMNKVIREMKALLTGKSYRRIMTSKQNELGVLAHFFNEVTRNLESITSDVKDHARIQKELNTAQKIQNDLLPKNLPNIPGLEVTAKTRPASEIGGDTFDFIQKGDRNLIYIGDSTGHGIPAGIVMIMVDTLIETFIDMYEQLTDIMILLNKYLKPHLQTTMFMTLILLEWIAETKTINWVGAGHEQIIHLKTATGQITSTPAGGIAVGMLPDNSKMVKEQNITLEENDFVILFSDGIVEAKNVTGQTYDLSRLENIVKTHASPQTTTDEMFKQIATDVGRFMEGHEQEDDMTLIVIKCKNQTSQTQASPQPAA